MRSHLSARFEEAQGLVRVMISKGWMKIFLDERARYARTRPRIYRGPHTRELAFKVFPTDRFGNRIGYLRCVLQWSGLGLRTSLLPGALYTATETVSQLNCHPEKGLDKSVTTSKIFAISGAFTASPAEVGSLQIQLHSPQTFSGALSG